MQQQIRNIFLFLHSADLVWKFQQWLGIEKIPSNTKKGKFHKDGAEHHLTNGFSENFTNGSTKKQDILNEQIIITRDKNDSFRFRSKLFYYIFKFGSFLGQEEFYIVFFPFWFWHFDAPTGRRVMFIWMVCMHIGQVAKDYFRWPRPKSPPVVQLENTFLSEYGMPSTHATVALSIPFCVMFYQKDICGISVTHCAVFVLLWSSLVCLSRIYMGVHSFLEVFAGLAISVVVTTVLILNVDTLDYYLMKNYLGPVVLTLATFSVSFLYPNTRYTFTRSWSDAIAILASTTGILCGSWMEFNLLRHSTPMFCIYRLRATVFGSLYVLLKTVSGVVVILLAKLIAQHTYDLFFKQVFNITKDTLANERKLWFELPRKFLAYFAVGFNVFVTPAVLRVLESFFTSLS